MWENYPTIAVTYFNLTVVSQGIAQRDVCLLSSLLLRFRINCLAPEKKPWFINWVGGHIFIKSQSPAWAIETESVTLERLANAVKYLSKSASSSVDIVFIMISFTFEADNSGENLWESNTVV